MTVAEALRAAAERLAATSDTARLDAELLMAHALGASRSDLLLRHMRDGVPDGFAGLVERRAAREPVAHILGEQEFYGLLMAHFAIRGLMHEAALQADEDPDRLSFLHTVRVVRRKLPLYAAIPPSEEESLS